MGLQSPISSKLNYETPSEGKKMHFLEIITVGYVNKNSGTKTDSKIKTYQIYNPNTFWEK